MADFFEIDFLDVVAKKSGDAIPIRYSLNGRTWIHVTDGGVQDTGDSLIEHINQHYGNPRNIDAVVVTHPDGDHAGGLRKLFGEYAIGGLWMHRPWLYSAELIDRFSRFTSVENLSKRLRELYPNIAALEELAEEHGVPINEPFQGARIGEFWVMAPTRERYLDLVVESERTPEAVREEQHSLAEAAGIILRKTVEFLRSAWGHETFPEEDTSPENNMSVIQYANLCGKRVLLTGDAGRAALEEASDYAPYIGLQLPGIDTIQIPHHGSRHNVSTDILDRWLGPRLGVKPHEDDCGCTAVVSAAKVDKDHPRKAVVRAFIHRGAKVLSTEHGSKCLRHNAPDREGWGPAEAVPYPEEQEE